MHIAYFDCFSGISGDMIIGSMVNAGLDIRFIKNLIKNLGVGDVGVSAHKTSRCGLQGTKVDFSINENSKSLSYADLLKLFEDCQIEADIKSESIAVFEKIARAEELAHGVAKKELHFHEVAGVDLVIDIACSLAGLKELGIEKVYGSPLNLGGGVVSTGHGIIPVPSPAVANITIGRQVYSSDINQELTTPTGAAIITQITKRFEPLVPMMLERIGYGAGTNDNPQMPNLLRLFIGSQEEDKADTYSNEIQYKPKKTDTIILLEANIDDLNPQVYEFLFEQLFAAGALDVFLVPILMKKGRPAHTLGVIATPEKQDSMEEIIFKETTTIGIRRQLMPRTILARGTTVINTSFGAVTCKMLKNNTGEVIKIVPEYEECRKIAIKKGLALEMLIKKIQSEVWKG